MSREGRTPNTTAPCTMNNSPPSFVSCTCPGREELKHKVTLSICLTMSHPRISSSLTTRGIQHDPTPWAASLSGIVVVTPPTFVDLCIEWLWHHRQVLRCGVLRFRCSLRTNKRQFDRCTKKHRFFTALWWPHIHLHRQNTFILNRTSN